MGGLLCQRAPVCSTSVSTSGVADLGAVPRTLARRKTLGIRRPWRPFPVPLALGGEHGVKGGSAGGRDRRSDRGPAIRDWAATPTDHRGGRDAAFLRPRGC